MIFASLTMAIGCSIRCFTPRSPAFPILTMVTFVVDGLGGTVPLSAAAAFSAVWFPPKQRAFATAVCAESTNVGIAIAMVVGPAMVTSHLGASTIEVNGTTVFLEETVEWLVRDEVMQIMYIQTGIAVWMLILVLCYFPKKPPKPPSISAACERVDLRTGLIGAMKSWKLWLLFLPYGTGCGIYYAWTDIYDVILAPIGVTESAAGWLAFNGTVTGIVAALLVSLLAGFFMRYIKKIVLVFLVITLAACLIFAFICMRIMAFSMVWLYVTALVSGAVLYAIVPICFELACEVIYPISENVVCLMAQWWNNVFVILFFLLFLIPGQDRTWMNWIVVGSVGLSFISFAFLPELYARLSVDDGNVPEKEKPKPIGDA